MKSTFNCSQSKIDLPPASQPRAQRLVPPATHPLTGTLLLLLFSACLAGPVAHAQEGRLRAGPLAQEFPLTLLEGKRLEILGPLFHQEQADLWEAWALSPLLSYTRNRGVNSIGLDFIYPLINYDRVGKEYGLRILMLISFAGGQDQEEQVQRRVTLFPVFFYQASPDPDQRYLAVVPLAGRIQNRLFRDEIRFYLFPLYGQSRIGTTVTDNYVYPLFHIRRGDHLFGWQFWPLIGFEERVPFTRTNRFGNEELVPGHKKDFALWPIYFRQDLQIGTTNPVSHRILFPFYALERSPARDSSSYLWPLVTYTEDRGRQFRELGIPWPLIVFSRGEGKHLNRVWPFFSRGRGPFIESEFYMWPVYRRNRIYSPPLDRERTRILFFLYSHVHELNEQTGRANQRWDLWPLFSRREDREGNQRLQILAPIEPFLPHNSSLQRNWSPLWSIWRSEKSAQTGASSQSLLWNLYRRDVIPEARMHSAMFGLFQYETSQEGKRLRLFYLPILRTAGTAAPGGDAP
jgi:hypothetical protein